MAEVPVARHRVRIGVTASSGWAIRNFFNTEIRCEVAQQADIVVFCREANRQYFEALANAGDVSEVVSFDLAESRLAQIVRRLRTLSFSLENDIATRRIRFRHRMEVRRLSWLAEPLWWLGRQLARVPRPRVGEWLEMRLSRLPFSVQGDLAALVNLGPLNPFDNAVHRQAAAARVPVLSLVQSWDNLSSKGRIVTQETRVLVWGEMQREELRSWYPGLAPDRVDVVGGAQFDAYLSRSQSADRERLFGQLGIPLWHRLILYSTSSQRHTPDEHKVVADLVDDLDRGVLGEDVSLLIRCHPHDDARRYLPLERVQGVYVFAPSTQVPLEHRRTSGDSAAVFEAWIPPTDELESLALQLSACSVSVNTASTMTLDSLLCRRPVVNIMFDGERELPYLRSVERFYDYTHYRHVVKSAEVPIARSRSELAHLLREALSRDDGGILPRSALAEWICGPMTSSARARIAAAILDRAR